MEQAAALIWYLVVAGPQGGVAVLPGAYETRADCAAAITEYEKSAPAQKWQLQCLPGGTAYEEAAPDAGPPADEVPPSEQQ